MGKRNNDLLNFLHNVMCNVIFQRKSGLHEDRNKNSFRLLLNQYVYLLRPKCLETIMLSWSHSNLNIKNPKSMRLINNLTFTISHKSRNTFCLSGNKPQGHFCFRSVNSRSEIPIISVGFICTCWGLWCTLEHNKQRNWGRGQEQGMLFTDAETTDPLPWNKNEWSLNVQGEARLKSSKNKW